MKMVPLDIVDGSYKDEDLSFSAQDTVNYLPTVAEQNGTRTPTMLKTPPGLKPAVLVGVNAGEAGMQVAGPVRGTYNAEGRMFVVAGNQLFQITTAGVSVFLGTVPGVGRVSFSHNQITNGNEILVNNGNAGYIYNTVTQIFQRITDTSYPGGLRAVFINNRFVQIEPARRYLFNSDLADGLSYNALDRFTSETSPDLVMGIESIGNQLAVFSSTTTEWFEDTGANPQPFRSTGIVADKGAAGPFCTAKLDNQLFFLADDGVFYRYQGYNPVRISTKPIEQAIRNKNWFNAFTTIWEDSGYAVCYWTFPDGQTWGYDASTNKWHRRESYGFNRWRLSSLTYWNNRWYGGDFQAGKLYQLDWDYILEGDQEFEGIRGAGVIADNQNRVIHERLELAMNTGMVETVPVDFVDQPTGPSISGSAPDGAVGIAYDGYTYTTTPGDAPIARTVVQVGSMPPGLTFNQATATISATTPTALGEYPFTLRVYDQAGLRSELQDSITITAPSFALNSWSGSQTSILASASGESWETSISPGVGSGIVLLAASPTIVHVFETTGAGRYSADYGATWDNLVGATVSQPPRSEAYSSGAYVMFPSSGDSFRRSVDGINYTSVDATQSRSWFASCARGGTFLVGSTTGNVAVSSDGGVTWEVYLLATLLGTQSVATVFCDSKYFYARCNARMFRSLTALSGTWQEITPPTALDLLPSNGFAESDGIIYIYGDQAWRSTDHGDTWGSPQTLSETISASSNSISFNGKRLIVGTRFGIEIDDGGSWTEAYHSVGQANFLVASMVEVGNE